MDVSTPPKLRLACLQATTELSKQVHLFMEWSVGNKEYEQEASIFTWLNKLLKQQSLSIVLNLEQVMD